MLQVWHRKVFLAAHSLQSLYYRWHSKRLRWILHLTFLKKCVVKLQSAYRRRIAKRLCAVMRFLYLNKTALRLQRSIRRFIGACRWLRRKRLIHLLQHTFSPQTHLSRFSIADGQVFFLERVIGMLYDRMILGRFHSAWNDTQHLLLTHLSSPIDNEQSLMLARLVSVLSKAASWSKFGRTKQVNAAVLEQSLGSTAQFLYQQRNALLALQKRIAIEESNRAVLREQMRLEQEGKEIELVQPEQSTIQEEPFEPSPDPTASMLTVRWHDFQLSEVIDVLFQLTSWSSCSLLSLYDACYCKSDILHFLCHFLHATELLILGNYINPSTPMCTQPIIPLFGSMVGDNNVKTPSIELQRLLRRAWKLTDRAKNLISTGSPEAYELSQRIEVMMAMNAVPQLIFRGKHEFVLRQQVMLQTPVVYQSEEQKKGSKKRAAIAEDLSSLTVQVSMHVMLAGRMAFVFGHVDSILPSSSNSSSRHPWQRALEDGLSMQGCCPLQPLVLFSSEVHAVALAHQLYLKRGQQAATPTNKRNSSVDESDTKSIDAAKVEAPLEQVDEGDPENEISKAKPPPAAALSSRPILDDRLFREYMLDHLVLQPVSLPSLECNSDFNLQPQFIFSLPFITEKREKNLAHNEIRYATILLQRMYRGFAGRRRFQQVLAKHKEIMRRWWLSCKVLDRLKLMRKRHEHAAVLIQCHVKGWSWRKYLKLMQASALIVQCIFRIYRAKLRVEAERARLMGGPQVIEMIYGGRLVKVLDRTFMLRVFRCGCNYRLEGLDMLRGMNYEGICYQQELRTLLSEYNEQVVDSLNGDRLSLVSKGRQIQIWQHDKVTEYIVSHLQLAHRDNPVTNLLGANKLSNGSDLCLVVSNQQRTELFRRIQPALFKEITQHPYVQYMKPPPKTEKEKEQIAKEKEREMKMKALTRHHHGSINKASSLVASSSVAAIDKEKFSGKKKSVSIASIH